jgi:thiol-disulfide isomerase/thioredoxin
MKNIIFAILAILSIALFAFLQVHTKKQHVNTQEARVAANIKPLGSRFQTSDFSLPDLSGNETRLSDYRGAPVLMLFWTTWWPTCKAELPSIEKLNRRYKDGDLKILLINLKEEKEWVASFMKSNSYSSTVLLDKDGKVAQTYSVFGIPVSYLIDKRGNIAFRYSGYLDWSSDEMNSILSDLFSE